MFSSVHIGPVIVSEESINQTSSVEMTQGYLEVAKTTENSLRKVSTSLPRISASGIHRNPWYQQRSKTVLGHAKHVLTSNAGRLVEVDHLMGYGKCTYNAAFASQVLYKA